MIQKIKQTQNLEVEIGVVQTFSGNVSVAVVDSEGKAIKGGFILSFTQDGRIIRHPDIGKSVPFQTDLNGRILIEDNR